MKQIVLFITLTTKDREVYELIFWVILNLMVDGQLPPNAHPPALHQQKVKQATHLAPEYGLS